MTSNVSNFYSLSYKINNLSNHLNQYFNHQNMDFLERKIILTSTELANYLVKKNQREILSLSKAKELCFNLCTLINCAEDKKIINLNMFSILLCLLEEIVEEIDLTLNSLE